MNTKNQIQVVTLVVLTTIFCAPFAVRAEETKASGAPVVVSGYVDAQAKVTSGDATDEGFSLNDAAFMISKSGKTFSGLIDIPFEGNLSAAGSSFSIASAKGQAFVAAKYEMGLRWKAGVWDSIYGFEAADSVERYFADVGLISAQNFVATNTGLQVGYDVNNNMGFTFWAANPNGQAGLQRGKFDMGLKADFTFDPIHASIGGMAGRTDVGGTTENHTLINVMAGVKSGAMTLDAEFDYHKMPGFTDAANMFGIFANYDATDWMSASARFEYLMKSAGIDKQMEFTVGPTFKATESAAVRLSYMFASATLLAGGEAEKGHAGDVSFTYKF